MRWRHFRDCGTLGDLMETRQLIAYALIVLLLACLTGVWLYLTRERRANNRSQRQFDRRKLERLAGDTQA
jgi:uncharacterized iron-regulated membrane protein